MGLDAHIAEGRAALAACDWDRACAAFERALADGETPEAVHGLGLALYWDGQYGRALDRLERAYALERSEGAVRSAARTAVQLAMLHGLITGDGAAVSGWIGHARGLLEDEGECVEAGWLELLLAAVAPDPTDRAVHAATARRIADRFDDPDLEYDALAYEGLAAIETGAVTHGMTLIDQALAAVTSGMVDDPWPTAEILCTLFHACEMTADVKRAEEWLVAVDRHVERTGERPTFGICRMHYGGVLTAAGRWSDAERELLAAIEVYDAGFRGSRFEPVLRLAELRARQGRFEEAERLIAGYEEHPEAVLPRARAHLARGEVVLAVTLIERHLVRRGRGVASAPALGLLVQSELTRDATDAAAAVADELGRLARRCEQPAIAGLADLASARVAAATGADEAIAHFERALGSLAGAGLTHELARARLELAMVLAETEPEVARAEARIALACFQDLEASHDADAAAGLLRRLGEPARSRPRASSELTTREREVLDLLAEGLSNAEIAARLYISRRTAEHHVSSILAKLGVTNRTEAAAHALREGRRT